MTTKTTSTATNATAVPALFLLSLDSYSSHGSDVDVNDFDHDDDDKNRKFAAAAAAVTTSKTTTTQSQLQQYNDVLLLKSPSYVSCCITSMVYILFLVLMEQMGRYILYQYQHYEPLLTNPTNRYILARHLFVDTFSCIICSVLGWYSRYESFYPIIYNQLSYNANDSNDNNKGKNATNRNPINDRLYTYIPNAFRLSLFFFSYQIKNLMDTILWDDGIEYIFHHVFSLITAYGAMKPGCGHMYTLFFFGISEISTAILCILANFDDHHGVIGLGDAYPITKVICGAIFVVLFILCRCILWPIHSYYFCKDMIYGLDQAKANNTSGRSADPRAILRKKWMIFFLISLSGLSILQIAWLGQIFILGKQELQKVGLL